MQNRILILGYGVQGRKRHEISKQSVVATVDPCLGKSVVDFGNIHDVPKESFDSVLMCVPDSKKEELLRYCIENSKHVLVEKPLIVPKTSHIHELSSLAKKNEVVFYTAYNHRFEPHFVRMKQLIDSGELGRIYSCRMFYGNGTARLVRDSVWRDKGLGVIADLGSHLIDTCFFWFSDNNFHFNLTSYSKFENKSFDHAIISSEKSDIRIELEMTLCMWRNHFTCDILAENGSAHIESLCKWGPSKFTHRKRILPSGRPNEEQYVCVTDDPTWESEINYFDSLVDSKSFVDKESDEEIHNLLDRFKLVVGES